MQSSLRIRKKRKLELASALREAHTLHHSAEMQIVKIDESEFEQIDLQLIDPAIPINTRLKILEEYLKNGKSKKADLFLFVLYYLMRYVVGDKCELRNALVLMQKPNWSLTVGQGVLSSKQTEQLISLKIMHKMAYIDYSKFLDVFGKEIIDQLLELYGSTQKLINQYVTLVSFQVLWILNFLSQDIYVFHSVFTNFHFRSEIVRCLEQGLTGQEEILKVALYSSINLLRDIKFSQLPDSIALHIAEADFTSQLQTQQMNIAVLLVKYLNLPEFDSRSHSDALRALGEYVQTNSGRASFLAEVGILEPLEQLIKPMNQRVTGCALKFLNSFSTLEDKILEARILKNNFVEKIAQALFHSNSPYVKVKAASILANLVASSTLFIQKFIDIKLFEQVGECLSSLNDIHDLNKVLILILGNGAFSASPKQIQELQSQNIVDSLILKAELLSIDENESARYTLSCLLQALDVYLKRADQKLSEEKMVPKCDLFSDLASPRWGGEVSSLSYKILVKYCGYEENEMLIDEVDDKIEF